MGSTVNQYIQVRPKEADSRSVADASWVQIPLLVPSQLVQMVRIPLFHRGEPGSIPGLGNIFFFHILQSNTTILYHHINPHYINIILHIILF